MAGNYIDFSIRMKDEASEVVKTVGVNMEHLRKGVQQVTEEVGRVQRSIVDWAQAAQAADLLGQSVQQLYNVGKDLTDAYQVQLVAETQLETVMRQRMSATTEEIQRIKELASAQQELGVIGDEVQLSGAQQMATFLNEKASLDSLIPAMNNLLAQQKGLNATNQDAIGIGNMMGKAMQGQVDVLQRVGVTFTDAQKKVLQYGDESERAAMLAQVIRDNVGDMNAELARTDAGKQKQLENTLGDIKEKMGALVHGAMPFLTMAAYATTAATGALRLYSSIRSVTAALQGTSVAASVAAMHTRVQAAAMRLLTIANGTATVSAHALRIATIALYATITGGLYLAVEGLISLFTSYGSTIEETAGKQDLLKDSTEAFKNTASQLKGELDMEISALAALIKSHGDETGKVAELNRKYGEALGYHKSAAEWYDVLIRKSGDYCKAIGYEAQAKVIAAQKAEKELQLEEVRKRKQALIDSGEDTTTKRVLTSGLDIAGNRTVKLEKRQVNTEAYTALKEQEEALTQETGLLQQQFDSCITKIAESNSALEPTARTTDVAAMSYDELSKEIEITESSLKSLAPSEVAEINRLTTYNKLLKARKEVLGEKYGMAGGKSNGGGKDKDVVTNPKSYKELSTAIEYYEKQLLNTKPAETETISLLTEKINKYREQQQVVSAQLEAAKRPKELDTLENIDKELTYQKNLRSRCTQEKLAGIDAEIERLNGLKSAFEEHSHAAKSLDQIHTYQQLADEISFYEAKMRTATETERVEIQKQISALEELRNAWDMQLNDAKRPDDISKLNTIKELSDAVSYYEGIQRNQSAQEIIETQRTIDALNQKKAALERLTEIPKMQQDTARLDGMGDAELKLELKLIGLDGIKEKIRSLQKMLDDTKNPLDEEQRKEVTKLINSYQKYEKILGDSIQSNTKLVDGLRTVGDAMGSISEVVGGAAGQWLQWGANCMQAIATAIPQIDTLIGAKNAEATANAASAVTGAASSVASIPWVGPALAVAAVASLLGAFAAIPKFANGGLAYGPTLGLFGEYAGASNNPEVVAPLNKLKQLIQPADGGGGGRVEFIIDGRTLKGILNKVDNFNSRTR